MEKSFTFNAVNTNRTSAEPQMFTNQTFFLCNIDNSNVCRHPWTAALLSSDTHCICWCGLMQASRVNTSVRAQLAKRSTGKEGGYLEMMCDKLASFLKKKKRSIQMVSTQTTHQFLHCSEAPSLLNSFWGSHWNVAKSIQKGRNRECCQF